MLGEMYTNLQHTGLLFTITIYKGLPSAIELGLYKIYLTNQTCTHRINKD